jgi:glycosyltransferase involved in cell wall biosynthesis
MKKVSVIIPTYNRAHLISDAIKSVLNQNLQDCWLEIIVVDDGSNDSTQKVISGFGEKIKYVYQKNMGVGAARNRGITEATGEWLSFLDSDDLWLPDKLSLQFKILEIFPKYKIIHSNFFSSEGDRIIIPKGLEYWVATLKGTDINQVDWSKIYTEQYNSADYGILRSGSSFPIYSGNLFRELLYTVCANCWTSLIHKDCLIDNIRFAHLPIVEDYWFYCRISENNDVIFIDCPTVQNRAHPGPREN